ncbi:MAG: hypothetical protein ACNS62_08415 [Candidatus Cyclobacteriaceae bacterium M3_2C_046]
MNKYLGLLAGLLLLASNVLSQNLIRWQEDVPLQWGHFNGAPHDSSFAAASFIGIDYQVLEKNFWTGRIKLDVFATFNCDSSWVLPEKADEITLQHEQIHFNIAELYARKIRKMVDLEIRTTREFRKNFPNLYRALYLEYYDCQNQFEEETDLGRDLQAQQKWAARIRHGLNLLPVAMN